MIITTTSVLVRAVSLPARQTHSRIDNFAKVFIGVGGDVGPFVRIGPQVEYLRHPQGDEGLGPDAHGSSDSLLHEDDLPVVVAQSGQLLVVVDVDERFAGALLRLSGKVRQEVVAVEMHFVGCAPGLIALESFWLTSVSPATASKVGSQSS